MLPLMLGLLFTYATTTTMMASAERDTITARSVAIMAVELIEP